MSDITLTNDRYSVIKEHINDIRECARCLEKELEGLSPPKDLSKTVYAWVNRTETVCDKIDSRIDYLVNKPVTMRQIRDKMTGLSPNKKREIYDSLTKEEDD
jgi:hypothetical protein